MNILLSIIYIKSHLNYYDNELHILPTRHHYYYFDFNKGDCRDVNFYSSMKTELDLIPNAMNVSDKI